MTEVPRIAVTAAHARVQAGQALLVCAYDDDAAFRGMQLEGAIPYREFLTRFERLPRDQELIFYCA